MKNLIFIAAILAAFTTETFAQHLNCDGDHSSEARAGESTHFELDQGTRDEVHDEAHAGPGHEDHSKDDDEVHANRDHEDPDGHESEMALSEEMLKIIDLRIAEAAGGRIFHSVSFPVEIMLNRDRVAAVSPRYPSIVRQVFAEIGDAVKKDARLAELENRETLAVYTVSSPLDGVVISKNISVGEAADEDRVLYEVADLSTVWANISVFPQYRHHIRKGQQAILSASDGHHVETTIDYISPLISTETRTLPARCVLEGAEECFAPGAFVSAEVVVRTRQAEVRVEKAAVQRLEGRSVVFIADEHGFQPRDVAIGLSGHDYVEIKSGLEPGEKYVAKGAFELKAEMVTSGMDSHTGHGH